MLILSDDPKVAEQQMAATIFYLTTFGYIDGDFDASEKEFVVGYIQKLVEHRVEHAMPTAKDKLKAEIVEQQTTHFTEVFEAIDREVRELFHESVADSEDQEKFVHAKLKLRCFEIFQSFEREGQEALMDSVDELLMADGYAHPAELAFRAELAQILQEDLEFEIIEEETATGTTVTVRDPRPLKHDPATHPFFSRFEHHYSADRQLIIKQLAADREVLKKTREALKAQRDAGTGKLQGMRSMADVAPGSRFLDGHVYCAKSAPGDKHELLVLGDLHGCYSCLKAAVMQTNFFGKVAKYRADPDNAPKPSLVLLGDYIDRGIYSYNGVLRAAMQLFVTAPEHVYVLRGNHEYYLEYEGDVYGGVRPAEAINTLKPHVPTEVFKDYLIFFEQMPNMLLFDDFLFVHGGIPRDLTIKEKFEGLWSLNDPDFRFQMMWSDPSSVDVVPAKLQEESARFPFGRLQFVAFAQRLGIHTLVRGHEKVDAGFKSDYEDGKHRFLTVFSAGGADNEDLPIFSSYREVVPHALLIKTGGGETSIEPFAIDYAAYNDPETNRFFERPPEILMRE